MQLRAPGASRPASGSSPRPCAPSPRPPRIPRGSSTRSRVGSRRSSAIIAWSCSPPTTACASSPPPPSIPIPTPAAVCGRPCPSRSSSSGTPSSARSSKAACHSWPRPSISPGSRRARRLASSCATSGSIASWWWRCARRLGRLGRGPSACSSSRAFGRRAPRSIFRISSSPRTWPRTRRWPSPTRACSPRRAGSLSRRSGWLTACGFSPTRPATLRPRPSISRFWCRWWSAVSARRWATSARCG